MLNRHFNEVTDDEVLSLMMAYPVQQLANILNSIPKYLSALKIDVMTPQQQHVSMSIKYNNGKTKFIFYRSLDGKQFILPIEQMSDDISYMKVIDIIIKLKFQDSRKNNSA